MRFTWIFVVLANVHSTIEIHPVGGFVCLPTLVVPVPLTLPAVSVKMTHTESVPSAKLETSMPLITKLPLGQRIAVQFIVPPLLIVYAIVAPLSAAAPDPIRVTLFCAAALMVTLLFNLIFDGVAGAMESLVIITGEEAELKLPAASCTLATKVFTHSASDTLTENEPLDDVLPTIVLPL